MLRDKAKSKLVKGSVTALCLFAICTLALTTMVMPITTAAGASAAAGGLKSEPRGGVHCHNIRIINYSSTTDSSGNIALLGKITNNFTKPISNIRITADLYNANGKLIGIENPYLGFNSLDPTQTESFKIPTYMSNKTLDHYDLVCGGTVQYNFVG